MGVETHRRSQDGNGHESGDRDGAGMGTRTGVETTRRTQDGNGNESRERAGTGTGTGVETR